MLFQKTQNKTSRISLVSGLLLNPLSDSVCPERFSSAAEFNLQLLEPNIFLRLSVRMREGEESCLRQISEDGSAVRSDQRLACKHAVGLLQEDTFYLLPRMRYYNVAHRGKAGYVSKYIYKKIYNLHFQMRFSPAPVQTNVQTLIYRGRYLALLFTPVKKGL